MQKRSSILSAAAGAVCAGLVQNDQFQKFGVNAGDAYNRIMFDSVL